MRRPAVGEEEPVAAWYVYILRCADGTLYTGISNDVAARLEAHNCGRGAKYTASRLPVELAYAAEVANRSAASRLEKRIKKLTRTEKLDLLKSTENGFATFRFPIS